MYVLLWLGYRQHQPYAFVNKLNYIDARGIYIWGGGGGVGER